jgi:hypothetical protein
MNNVVDIKKLMTIAVVMDLAILIIIIDMQGIKLGFNVASISLVGIVTTVTWIFWTTFRLWLWKIPLLQNWLVLVPNLNGSWHGKLESTWVDPDTKKSPNPIDTIAVIKQSLTVITIDLSTNGMQSNSTVATVQYDPTRRTSIISYVYLSEPLAKYRKKNVIHYGAAKLNAVKKDKSVILSGTYWTDNETCGDVTLERIK